MGRQLARLTLETTPGVFPSGSIPAGDQVLLDLPVSNALTLEAKPNPITIRSAAFGNRRVKTIPGKLSLAGDLTAHFRPSQAEFFLKVLTSIGAGPCFSLPTFTVDRAEYIEDGACTPRRRRYLGAMASGSLTGASEGDAQLLMVKMSLMARSVATIDGTAFPIPDFDDYSDEDPYLFHQSATHFTIKTLRAEYKDFTINFGNILKSFPDETRYTGAIGWFGRDISLEATLKYKTLQDRIDFEESTSFPMSLAFDNGETTTTLQFNANNVFSDIADDRPLDDYYTQKLTVQNMVDLTVGTDFSYTVATNP